eukprot:6796-Heterococcus_DN1.PRE.2
MDYYYDLLLVAADTCTSAAVSKHHQHHRRAVLTVGTDSVQRELYVYIVPKLKHLRYVYSCEHLFSGMFIVVLAAQMPLS